MVSSGSSESDSRLWTAVSLRWTSKTLEVFGSGTPDVVVVDGGGGVNGVGLVWNWFECVVSGPKNHSFKTHILHFRVPVSGKPPLLSKSFENVKQEIDAWDNGWRKKALWLRRQIYCHDEEGGFAFESVRGYTFNDSFESVIGMLLPPSVLPVWPEKKSPNVYRKLPKVQ